MMADLPGDTFDFDSGFAGRYDLLVRRTIFGYDQLFPMILGLLMARQPQSADLLVVGSGTGAELITFGRAMPAWRLIGVDPAAQMIQLARARLASQGLSDRVRLYHGNVDGLAPALRFDAATLVLVLHFLPDDGSKLALLQAIAARLKPGGSLALVDLGGDPADPAYPLLLAGWKNFIVQNGMPPDEVDHLLRQASESQHFISEQRLLDLLAAAGFLQPTRFYGAFLHSGWITRLA